MGAVVSMAGRACGFIVGVTGEKASHAATAPKQQKAVRARFALFLIPSNTSA
jgi:hypothetical protein|tara:strand:- start:2365 stop:2520 length:156 start_codon:yes stop_codon:yes gene_type:complete